MQKLKKTYRKNGFNYVQVKRNEKAAIYKQIDPTTGHESYEVFMIKVTKPFTLKSKGKNPKVYNYPAMEKFPGNEDFGKIAWAYMTIETTTEKYKELSK